MITGYEIRQRELGVGEKVIVVLIADAIVPGSNFGGFVFNGPLAQELLDLLDVFGRNERQI
jgi:hypothetical protein